MITPFWTATPKRAMKPMIAGTESGNPASLSPMMPPTIENGILSMTSPECFNELNVAKSNKKIKKRTTGTTIQSLAIARS